MPDQQEHGSEDLQHQENGHIAHQSSASPPDEPPSKRQKRGKYVSKACGECQKRKIKCDGKVPCRGCTLKGRNCRRQANDMHRRELPMNGIVEQAHSPSAVLGAGADPYRDHTSNELVSRLDRIEHQLSFLVSSASRGLGRLDGPEPDRVANIQEDATDSRARSLSSPGIERPPQASVPTFSGETSIAHTLDQVEGHLVHTGGAYEGKNSAPMSQTAKTSLPSSPIPRRDDVPERWEKIYIRKVLSSFDIELDRPRWDDFLDTFSEEVHILYPMVHLPTLRSNYTNMWDRYLLFPERELGRRDCRFTIAQIWICLAIGRCTQSPRIHSEDGRHSAGWSLYDAAMHLIGDLLSSFQECSSPVVVLQTLVLIVIYLFRLDANERAEKSLALAITHSHHLGLHRRKVVETISAFNSEMVRRVWWCIYIMDRRLAIETGHPFFIQDVNVDAPLPRELSDDWLTRYRDDPRTSCEIEADVQAEVVRVPLTTIPYLIAMISYSRVVGKAWEGMYGVSRAESTPSPLLCEYLEQHVSRAQREIQPEFVQGHDGLLNPQSSVPWWRIKQRMLMHIRWYSLRLLIRKPMLQQAVSPSNPVPDNFENEVTCMHVAHNIIQDFNKIPKERARSTFPFLHYFVTATMISLGLIIKEPSFKATHGNTTIQAARLLRTYCRETWISGRMARTVFRLNQMAARILNDSRLTGQSFPQQLSSHQDGRDAIPALSNQFPDTVSAADIDPQQNTFLRPGHDPNNIQNQPLGHSNGATAYYSTADHDLHYTPSQQDTWTPGLANVVMADFDFEETAVSNLGPPLRSCGHDNFSLPNPIWPQENALAFTTLNTEFTRSYGPPSTMLPEGQAGTLSAGTQQDVLAQGEPSGMESDWLQSLFWDSIGSYS